MPQVIWHTAMLRNDGMLGQQTKRPIHNMLKAVNSEQCSLFLSRLKHHSLQNAWLECKYKSALHILLRIFLKVTILASWTKALTNP